MAAAAPSTAAEPKIMRFICFTFLTPAAALCDPLPRPADGLRATSAIRPDHGRGWAALSARTGGKLRSVVGHRSLMQSPTEIVPGSTTSAYTPKFAPGPNAES